MAPRRDHTSLDNDNSSGSPELLALSVVGDRNYVRALELVPKMRERFPDAKLEFRLRRPLACAVHVKRKFDADWCSRVTVQTAGKREELFIVNADSDRIHRVPDRPMLPHMVLLFREYHQRYLVLGSGEEKILDVVFETYRKKMNRRPVILSMSLAFAPAGILHFLTLRIVPYRSQWLRAEMFHNGKLWVEFVCLR
jgi:hypothetical protein